MARLSRMVYRWLRGLRHNAHRSLPAFTRHRTRLAAHILQRPRQNQRARTRVAVHR